MTTEHLSREHGRTLQAIFQHPAAHNLEWRQIMALLEATGTVTEVRERHYHMAINEQTHDMRWPQHKDLADIEELIALRHFLERAGVVPTGPYHQGDPGDDTSTQAS